MGGPAIPERLARGPGSHTALSGAGLSLGEASKPGHVARTAPRRASSKRRRTGGGSRTLVSCLRSRTLARERHRLRTGSRHVPGGVGTRRLSLWLSTASRNAHRTGRGALLRPWRPKWVSLPLHRRHVPAAPLADGPGNQARTIGTSVPFAVPPLPIGVTGPRCGRDPITILVCSSLFNVQMVSLTLVKMTRETSATRSARLVPFPGAARHSTTELEAVPFVGPGSDHPTVSPENKGAAPFRKRLLNDRRTMEKSCL